MERSLPSRWTIFTWAGKGSADSLPGFPAVLSHGSPDGLGGRLRTTKSFASLSWTVFDSVHGSRGGIIVGIGLGRRHRKVPLRSGVLNLIESGRHSAEHVRFLGCCSANQTVHRTGASRFAQRQIERHRRLPPVIGLSVLRENEDTPHRWFIGSRICRLRSNWNPQCSLNKPGA